MAAAAAGASHVAAYMRRTMNGAAAERFAMQLLLLLAAAVADVRAYVMGPQLRTTTEEGGNRFFESISGCANPFFYLPSLLIAQLTPFHVDDQHAVFLYYLVKQHPRRCKHWILGQCCGTRSDELRQYAR